MNVAILVDDKVKMKNNLNERIYFLNMANMNKATDWSLWKHSEESCEYEEFSAVTTLKLYNE